jgi:hypothetical protein
MINPTFHREGKRKHLTYNHADGPDPSRAKDELDLIPKEVARACDKCKTNDGRNDERIIGRTSELDV